MASPTKPGAIGTPGYSAVPNPEGSPTVDQFTSPDPNRSSMLSPEMTETSTMLRPNSGLYPAPSLMSRNSTIPGTPLPGDRSSWGSAAALAPAAEVSLPTTFRWHR